MFECNRLRGNRHHEVRTRRSATLLPGILLGGFAAVWLAAFIPAAGMLLRYEWTPGAIAEAPRTLLRLASFETASLAIAGQGPTGDAKAGLLIVAIHPRCTCTRATLEELQRSANSWHQPFRAIFLMDQPAGKLHPRFDWRQSATLREAQSSLHAEVLDDEDGRQAARLGALTSGEVLFYSPPGPRGERRLLFSGGVTAGRGMAGGNGGLTALEDAVQRSATHPDANVRHSPVYGCGLSALDALTPVQTKASNQPGLGPLASAFAGSAPQSAQGSGQELAQEPAR